MMAAREVRLLREHERQVSSPTRWVLSRPEGQHLGRVENPLDAFPDAARRFRLRHPHRLEDGKNVCCRNLVDGQAANAPTVRVSECEAPTRLGLFVAESGSDGVDVLICDVPERIRARRYAADHRARIRALHKRIATFPRFLAGLRQRHGSVRPNADNDFSCGISGAPLVAEHPELLDPCPAMSHNEVKAASVCEASWGSG
jgi:hypothetical protein